MHYQACTLIKLCSNQPISSNRYGYPGRMATVVHMYSYFNQKYDWLVLLVKDAYTSNIFVIEVFFCPNEFFKMFKNTILNIISILDTTVHTIIKTLYKNLACYQYITIHYYLLYCNLQIYKIVRNNVHFFLFLQNT